ncbi:MAG: NTP transferase domain-containing protein, partial [Chitinophagaceae bacterium]|nr:NTP transferase domain-containing protein [Chitinophagaceae bacterium]
QTAVDKLTALEMPIVLSVNENQLRDYTAVFNSNELICDDPSLSIHGPLAGVMSVHLQHPDEDLLVLACDMPLMETDLLKELLLLYQQYSAKEAFVYASDGEPEPLCGIYKSGGLAHILSLYHNNKLPRHSMKYMLEHVATLLVSVPDGKKKCFRNFNAHAELNGL